MDADGFDARATSSPVMTAKLSNPVSASTVEPIFAASPVRRKIPVADRV